MIDERIIKLALDFLLKFPDEGMNILNSDLCMPNIPFPTMGGHTFGQIFVNIKDINCNKINLHIMPVF